MMHMMLLNSDCRFFRGSKPCYYNKVKGQECHDCPHYDQIAERVLIIKLDAIGDVLRTSCITPKIREIYPKSHITWITRKEALELVEANPDVDAAWAYGVDALGFLHTHSWDYVYSCSNDHVSATMATMAKSHISKIGFLLSESWALLPTNDMAKVWLEMAAFDSLKRGNQLSFQEILYGICGFNKPIHRPRLVIPKPLKKWASQLLGIRVGNVVTLIGVNTGAGNRWPKKVPSEEQLICFLSETLASFTNIDILLLGGPQEIEKNLRIAAGVNSTRVHNWGCNFTLLQFAALISICQVLICGDTLGLHIATSLGIPSIAFFGPTSMAEIYPYNGLIKKLSADSLECLCCYSDCDKTQDCMRSIPHAKILESIDIQLKRRI